MKLRKKEDAEKERERVKAKGKGAPGKKGGGGKGRGKQKASWDHQTWGASTWQPSWQPHPWAGEKRWNVIDNRWFTTASTEVADRDGDSHMFWDEEEEEEYSGNPWTSGEF